MLDKLRHRISGHKINDLESIQESKAFCMKPWVHLFVSHFGTVVPCCLTPWHEEQALGNVNKSRVEEIWNGKPMRDFRKKMLRDEQDSRCKQCYQNEKVGLRSTRKMINQVYAHKLDWVKETQPSGKVVTAKPIYWDIRFSNLCNFRCRICGHHSSSNWYDDAKATGQISHETRVHKGVNDFRQLIPQLESLLPDLEEIYFAGGEPLIMEEHYVLLDLLLKHGKTDLKLRYATNFSQTFYKKKDVFDLWKQFPNVYLHVSLDGNHEKGEFQRKGQDWTQVLENRQRLMEKCPHIDFMITPTISLFNVLHLPDFHREWVEQGLVGIDEFMAHTLKSPDCYSLKVLPANLKDKVEAKLRDHLKWIREYLSHTPLPEDEGPEVEVWKDWMDRNKIPATVGRVKMDMVINEFMSAIDFMRSEDHTHLLPEFRKMTLELDDLRKESFLETFPELGEMLTT